MSDTMERTAHLAEACRRQPVSEDPETDTVPVPAVVDGPAVTPVPTARPHSRPRITRRERPYGTISTREVRRRPTLTAPPTRPTSRTRTQEGTRA
ncbi:hypothetical protein [Streptomyces sindenensis]|uniref:Uncharacterized protein n=1 Tax=Streptomyces sindenensis TaxID=67363 RepID=A0ABW6EUC0_9ACTN